jgi:hypothetical protein
MTTIPLNRTGTRAAADRLDEMLDRDDLPAVDEPAPGPTDEEIRREYIEEARPVGSHTDRSTDPASVHLLDSLGGRLAYERGGARLYEAILRKAEAIGHLQGLEGCIPDLRHIREEEIEHTLLLERVIVELGGDPTLETPCADVEGVMSSGLLQVVQDPRTSLLQCLRAAAVAELADLENWTALVRRTAGGRLEAGLAEEIGEALTHEQEHLATIRAWIVTAEGGIGSQQARRAH